MVEHWQAGLYLAGLSIVAAVLGLVYSPVLGVVAIMLALVGWFVAGSEWMEIRGLEEHDAEPERRDSASDPHSPRPKTPSDHGFLL